MLNCFTKKLFYYVMIFTINQPRKCLCKDECMFMMNFHKIYIACGLVFTSLHDIDLWKYCFVGTASPFKANHIIFIHCDTAAVWAVSFIWSDYNLVYIGMEGTFTDIYAFSRRFYPKRLTVHSGYTFFVSMCVPWELNPQPFALLTQCSTTEPQEHSI